MSSINKIRKDGVDYSLSTNDIYSTEEQIVGTWIDGKPLYRKVVQTKTPSTQGVDTILLDLSLLTIDYIKKIDAMIINANDGINLQFNYGYQPSGGTANSSMIFYDNLTKKLMAIISGGDGYCNKDLNVILEYTKTTDTGEV